MRKYWFFILFILFSCRNETQNEEEILARVYDKYLYSSELKDVIPKGTPIKDSLIMAKNYINNWVRQELLVNQAEKNLTEKQKNFEEQLKSYRNSLILYKYKSLLIKQKLDTIVTDNEIETYYNEKKDNFILSEDIVRMNYIKLIPDTVNINHFEELLRSENTENKAILDSICNNSAVDYYLNEEYWIAFNELIQTIPIKTHDQENFLRNHRYFKLDDRPFIYLIKFVDFRLHGNIAPIGYAKENIKRIILNKRKTKLLDNMENEIFNNALEHNNIEIF